MPNYKSKLLNLFLVVLLVLTSGFFVSSVRADELEEINKQIADLSKQLEMSKSAAAGVQKSLQPIQNQIDSIQKRIDNLAASIKSEELKITKLEASISKRELELNDKYIILASRIRKFYIRKSFDNPLLIFLSSSSASDLTREFGYRNTMQNEDKKVIVSVAGDINDLEADKKSAKELKEKLAGERKGLESAQVNLDKQAAPLRKVIKEAEVYQGDVSGKIAALSARQQAILAAKSGNFTTSVGDVPLADDPNSRPDFNPGFSPAFAMFSFGAYTHRNGMSQYGAKGRAETGQSAEDILRAYYPGSNLNKSYGVPGTINVTGYGSKSFEDEYMIGIYEMPSSFPQQALRAQAVAARTYAVRQGGSICATESCQVFKPAPGRNDAWVQAVRDTRGWVLEGGANAQYSSTTGGYGNNSGWDTKCGNRTCWTGDAYEKLAGSPWFYKGWYKDRSGATCGRSHPWLNNEEMSDIINAWIVYQSGDSKDRISPVDTSCWSGNPFSRSEMSSKANEHGGAVTSVSSASVVYSDSGVTANIAFATNKGTITISGSDFKTIFNLRAPGYISIKSPLFNIEKK